MSIFFFKYSLPYSRVLESFDNDFDNDIDFLLLSMVLPPIPNQTHLNKPIRV